MPHNQEVILSNIMLAIGTTGAAMGLVDLDLYLGIAVKIVSFVSLVIVIVLNAEKLYELIKNGNVKKNL